ncbi:MAG: type IV pilus modification PilV family protein [Gammaproteobacteria bacterium]
MHKESGFSLLEILIAFSILALALGILLNIFSSGVNNAAVAEEYTAALQIAEALMAQTGVETALQAGQTSGLEDDKYRWQVTVSPFNPGIATLDAPAITVTLFKVKVSVNWGDTNDRQIELTTLKLANKVHEQQ